MGKRVLLISQYFPPDISAASFRINDLYLALKKQGFDVIVLTAYPQKVAVEKVEKTHDIHRLKLNKIYKKTFLTYIRNYFGFMFKTISYSIFSLRKEEFDYVIVSSPPLFVALGGRVISFLKRTKLVIDIRDIWPDSAVSAGMLKGDGFLYKMTKVIEKYLYKKADVITCVSLPMKEYIYNQSNHKNIHVLYNGVSSYTQQKEISLNKKSISKKITIGYAGNIGIVQNMDIIIEICKVLSTEERSFYEFLIIGDGIERKRLELRIKEEKITNIQFIGSMSKDDTINQLEQVDLLFLSLIENKTLEKTIPSKLFDYLLNNKPIVTSIKGEGREILERLQTGLFFEANDAQSFIKVLKRYCDNQEYFDNNAKGNRSYVLENFDREKMFKDFLEELK